MPPLTTLAPILCYCDFFCFNSGIYLKIFNFWKIIVEFGFLIDSLWMKILPDSQIFGALHCLRPCVSSWCFGDLSRPKSIGLKFVVSRCPEHLPCIECYTASMVCYSSCNQNQLHVIDSKSQKLNIVLNTCSSLFISYIAKFVWRWHKMCSIFTE